tara:strand:- start:199 stop:516 length:318 start_codon:yes stop_codon:yes gene_type:complete
MKRFFKKDSFNGFQILTAFLVPTVVYLIFTVDWTDRFNRNKQVISCRKMAKKGIAKEIREGRLLTRKLQKEQYEVEMNFCLIHLPKILEKQERINNIKKFKEAIK